MPEIWRFAPASPNMNIRPPMTMATSAKERASGPVNVRARLFAARSHGDCARAIAGATAITEMIRRIMRLIEGRRGRSDVWRGMACHSQLNADDSLSDRESKCGDRNGARQQSG